MPARHPRSRCSRYERPPAGGLAWLERRGSGRAASLL